MYMYMYIHVCMDDRHAYRHVVSKPFQCLHDIHTKKSRSLYMYIYVHMYMYIHVHVHVVCHNVYFTPYTSQILDAW